MVKSMDYFTDSVVIRCLVYLASICDNSNAFDFKFFFAKLDTLSKEILWRELSNKDSSWFVSSGIQLNFVTIIHRTFFKNGSPPLKFTLFIPALANMESPLWAWNRRGLTS